MRKAQHLQPKASDIADAEVGYFAFSRLAAHIRVLSKSGEWVGLVEWVYLPKLTKKRNVKKNQTYKKNVNFKINPYLSKKQRRQCERCGGSASAQPSH